MRLEGRGLDVPMPSGPTSNFMAWACLWRRRGLATGWTASVAGTVVSMKSRGREELPGGLDMGEVTGPGDNQRGGVRHGRVCIVGMAHWIIECGRPGRSSWHSWVR